MDNSSRFPLRSLPRQTPPPTRPLPAPPAAPRAPPAPTPNHTPPPIPQPHRPEFRQAFRAAPARQRPLLSRHGLQRATQTLRGLRRLPPPDGLYLRWPDAQYPGGDRLLGMETPWPRADLPGLPHAPARTC